MAKRRRHTPEQVIRKLREGERMLGEGSDLAAVCKHLEVSEQTFGVLEEVIAETGRWPANIRMDNGTELTAHAMIGDHRPDRDP